MENALRTKPLEVGEQYEKQLPDCKRPMVKPCWSCAPKKSWPPCWATRTRNDPRPSAKGWLRTILGQPGQKLCQWFEMPRRSVYDRSTKLHRRFKRTWQADQGKMIERPQKDTAPRRICLA